MKSTTRLIVFACIASFFSYSCSESPVAEPVVPAKKVDPLPLENQWAGPAVADFKMILPKGNQITADGVDQLTYDFIFYDNLGFPIVYNDYSKFFTKVKVNGVEMDFKQAIKTSTLGTYNIEITINKITKIYPVVATTAEKKIVEIPIIFNFVSTDFSDDIVVRSVNNLNKEYANMGLKNVVFKLAEIDNDGKPLARKGVKFWNYNGVATDQMDYRIIWAKNKFAVNVYQLKSTMPQPKEFGALAGTNVAYAPGNNIIVIDNAFTAESLKKYGFWVAIHEMGHVLGLSDLYAAFNGECRPQEGVNDVEAYNRNTTTYNYTQGTYVSNCGRVFSVKNLMALGAYDGQTLTTDQLKIVQKTALNLKF
jgi:hypothetical protein